MAEIVVTAQNFEEEVLRSDKPVLVDFNADWCGPCKMLAPVIDELAEEHPEIKFVSVNIDDEEDLADDYDVFSIPCLVVFKNGEEADHSVGGKSKEEILELIDE
jgi:thioredoxin 1